MERKNYWTINFENYRGDDAYTEYFDTKEHAVAAFEEICEVCKGYDEFSRGKEWCEWINNNCGDEFTNVYLDEEPMPGINHSSTSMYFERKLEEEDLRG